MGQKFAPRTFFPRFEELVDTGLAGYLNLVCDATLATGWASTIRSSYGSSEAQTIALAELFYFTSAPIAQMRTRTLCQ